MLYAVSALTLEIYLVQYALFTDKLNFMFPLYLSVMYLMIFASGDFEVTKSLLR